MNIFLNRDFSFKLSHKWFYHNWKVRKNGIFSLVWTFMVGVLLIVICNVAFIYDFNILPVYKTDHSKSHTLQAIKILV